MNAHPLLPKLRALKLSGMADTLDERIEIAKMRNLSPVELLALLLDDEIDRRSQRRHERMVRNAGFADVKLLPQFDFSAVPELDRAFVLDMATCQFVVKKYNWIICGPTGMGKSHLATAIGYEAIKRRMTTLCVSVTRMLADLHASRADGSYNGVMKRITSCDLLILDDFGLRQLTSAGADDLYEIIATRYERGSIIITSNRALPEWPELFGNPLLASAALDRLTHHARVTIIKGDSYRQKQRKQGDTDTSSYSPSDGGCHAH